MKGNMENSNLENGEDVVLDRDDVAELLELNKDDIIEVKSDINFEQDVEFDEIVDLDDEIEKSSEIIKRNVRVSRDNYTEDEILDKICIICGRTNCRGIIILDKKICLDCEEKAVKADIKSDFYSDYKNKIIKNVVGKFKNQNLG
ncbi:MAG: sigma factor G inhibitor Gin [Sarcina sp.]